eukprot:18941_1
MGALVSLSMFLLKSALNCYLKISFNSCSITVNLALFPAYSLFSFIIICICIIIHSSGTQSRSSTTGSGTLTLTSFSFSFFIRYCSTMGRPFKRIIIESKSASQCSNSEWLWWYFALSLIFYIFAS